MQGAKGWYQTALQAMSMAFLVLRPGRRGGPQEDDGAVGLQVGLVDAIAVDGLAHPVAADDRDDDAHNEAGVLRAQARCVMQHGWYH